MSTSPGTSKTSRAYDRLVRYPGFPPLAFLVVAAVHSACTPYVMLVPLSSSPARLAPASGPVTRVIVLDSRKMVSGATVGFRRDEYGQLIGTVAIRGSQLKDVLARDLVSTLREAGYLAVLEEERSAKPALLLMAEVDHLLLDAKFLYTKVQVIGMAFVEVSLVDTKSGERLWSGELEAGYESNEFALTLGDYERALVALHEELLREMRTKIPEGVLGSAAAVAAHARPDVRTRLIELERLVNEELLDREEYLKKRSEILRDL